jgi:hypothetical protein
VGVSTFDVLCGGSVLDEGVTTSFFFGRINLESSLGLIDEASLEGPLE